MVKLKYKSLVTKETIDYYLSKIEDEKQKKELVNTVSKFDIRISTSPVIEEEEDYFYYKIWIWKRGTKKRAHLKLYNWLETLQKESESKKGTIQPTLGDILNRIRFYANVPEDFEEYCEISFRDPSDETSRTAHPRHLKRAERFKKFITKEEIIAIPFLSGYEVEEKIHDDDFFDLDDDEDLIPLNTISLEDKREYDKLKELQGNLEYYSRIMESYGYDVYTGNYDLKKFPITKEDKQKESIKQDFNNYFQVLDEYHEYIKQLIKKYDIKPSGNLVQRITFTINNHYHHEDNDLNNFKCQINFDPEFAIVAVNLEDFNNR